MSLDRGVLIKIQKCLSRARHKSTTESEAKAALFVAQKLMPQYNISQADLVTNSDDESKARYGARSKVAVVNVKNPFEMAHNKVLDWACSYKGGSATFSYRIGAADGLVFMANREKKTELEAARKKELDKVVIKEREEAMDRERELYRLHNVSSLAVDLAEAVDESENERLGFPDIDSMFDKPSSSLESIDSGNSNGREVLADFDENDENVIDLTSDVDDNIDKIIKREPCGFNSIPTSSVRSEVTSSSFWASATQLVRFRATSVQVADDYLKEHKIKLHKKKIRQAGWKDSEKIDFRQ
ncbi:hypothetical protein BDV29DRAFT_200891, partial [Aspergillus leporis]